MLPVLLFLVTINLLGCVIFLLDRQSANQGRKRVSPVLQYLCVALGGGPGALIARAPAPGLYAPPPLDVVLTVIIGVEVGVGVGLLVAMLPLG